MRSKYQLPEDAEDVLWNKAKTIKKDECAVELMLFSRRVQLQ